MLKIAYVKKQNERELRVEALAKILVQKHIKRMVKKARLTAVKDQLNCSSSV